MPSVADRLPDEDRARLGAMTPAQRVRLALVLGARDVETFRLAQSPPLSAAEARRQLARRRQRGRRPSRCVEEPIA